MAPPKNVVDQRIAVTGISAILPGGENINECWDTIKAGLDRLDDLPANRCDVTAYYNPKKGVKDKIYCKRGGFIPDYDFDAREFGMNMFQVEDADANQTLTLLKVKEALEDSGTNPFGKEKKNIGVVLGIGGGQKASHEFYSRMNYAVVDKVLRKIGLPDEDVETAVEKYKANFPEWRLDSFPGFLGNVTAGRCTNVFNLSGMNCVVDAACASSLIALKVAIDELLYGDCDEMVCGATCTDNSLGMYMAFSKTPVFSTDQSLTSYDKDTKGMLIGEGSVMLVLKRYADAVRDGDQIHGVIRGVASSSDGKASGIYSPTVDGQELAIRRAYERAGVSPGEVSLIEGHGTGTPVGDRIELTGLNNVFKPYFKENEEIAVGSIKSQIGHLKAVAGMAGIVKVIMALKHKILPASINAKNPPNLMDDSKIQDSPLYINTSARPWFTNNQKSRIAGVSSFGFGGANYHAVFEEAEREHTKAYRMHDLAQPVVLSAASPSALLKIVQAELQALKETATYAKMHTFREKYAIKPLSKSNARVGFLAETLEQVTEALIQIEKKLSSSQSQESWTLIRQGCHYRKTGLDVKGKVAALFSGQGSQYVNMFSDVAMNWPTFRDAVAKMDNKSEQICGIRTSNVLYPRNPYGTEEKLDNAEISTVRNAQLTTVACSLGSYGIFEKAGFAPDFAAGHSLGEFAALYAAGAVDEMDDVFEIVANRAKIMSDNVSNSGAMLAVIGAGASKIKVSNKNVWIGNSNGPDQIVLTGEASAIAREAELLKSKFKVVTLNVGDAYHSSFMKAANDKFVQNLRSKKFKAPNKAKLFSNVSAGNYGSNVVDQLKDHMTSTVKFEQEILNMYNAGARVFVEFGPRNTLTKLAENILKGKDGVFTVSTNNTSKIESETQLRECALKMCIAGIELNSFDPWSVPNKFKINKKAAKKTTLRLSAASYVSAKTLKAREKVMNDGKVISVLKGGAPVVRANVEKEQKLETELQTLKSQNGDLVRKLRLATDDLDKLRTRLDAMEGSSASASVRDDFVEINTIKKHRDMIVGMLGEYDKMIDTLSQCDTSEVEEKFVDVQPVASSSLKQVDAGLLNRAEEVVLQVLAEKTGYEVEMIEPDMELETELGIDSIKRVEILSEVQSILGVEAKDVDALSRTRTVGEVVNAMKFEIGAGAQPVSTQSSAKRVEPQTQVAPEKEGLLNKAEQAVMSVLAEKTGYEVEMIENDMELETELGIDSIKRVEILSEVQSQLNIEAKDVDALSRTRTVGEVIDALKAELAASNGTSVVSKPTPVAPTTPVVDNSKLEQAQTVVLQVLAEKTGYEVEMIEDDMELETELGIDSIKRVEILSEVQSILQIEAKDVDALSRTRTVGEVVSAMKAELGQSSSTPPAPIATPPQTSSATNTKGGDDAEKTVLQVLAEKTGYEVDMIEQDMELETELGIDSIKRVEILSEVQSLLNMEAKDVDALSRTRTVGEVIDALKKELGAGSSQPSSTSTDSFVVVSTGSAPTSNPNVENAAKVVLQVLAEKTGYEVDMIEDDMELETELGIDSIKRVEILSEVQGMLEIEAKDVDALSRTRTVGEVIDAMKKEMGGSATSGAQTTNDVPKVVSTTTAPASSSVSNPSVALAEKAVLDVLAEKTGYEVDMIENDMELETELGIDSIKRVEILSEVQAILNVEAKDVDALSRTRTVGEVIDAMKKEMSGTSPAPPTSGVVSTTSSAGSVEKAKQAVMEVLAEKTGYEVDMIEEDMELETELGIDSIKRVEILSEVQAILKVEAQDVDALSRTRTVGEVISALQKEMSGGSSSPNVSPSTKSREFVTTQYDFNNSDIRSKGCEELDLSYPGVSEINPASKELNVELGSILICGENQESRSLQNHLKNKFKVAVTTISNTGSEDDIKTRISSAKSPGAFIYLHGQEPIENALCCAKYLRKKLLGSKPQVLFVVRGDGNLGYTGNFSSVKDLEKYSLCGLAKTIALEWPEVKSKLLDVAHGEDFNSCVEDEITCGNRMLREIGYKDGKRYAVSPKGLYTSGNSNPTTSSDVWLVAGGARGITPLCIRELAKQVHGGRYILVGRSKLQQLPGWAQKVKDSGDISEKSVQKAAIAFIKSQGQKPRPAEVKKLVGSTLGSLEVQANMEDIGQYCEGNVEYMSCDINNAANVKSFVNKLNSDGTKITGFFHASGVLRDKLIQDKPIKDFNLVYDTKVRGFDNIYSCLDKAALKHVVLFSSLAGFYGNNGQSDYSMANEVLNKIAYFLSAKGINAKAFDFGPWDGGMVTPALKKHFQENNVQIIERNPGAETVAKIILNTSERQILVGNWGLAPQKPASKKNSLKVAFINRAFLKDHSIKGAPVVPFTYMLGSIIGDTLGLYPGYYVKEVKSCKLFRGVRFETDAVVEGQLDVEEKSDSNGELVIFAKMTQTVNGRQAPSYQAELLLSPKLVVVDEKPWSLEVSNATIGAPSDCYNKETLFHGPLFQGITDVRYNDSEIVAKVDLSQARFKEMEFAPLLLDIVFQAGLVLGKKVADKVSLPSFMENLKIDTNYINGSRSFSNCYVCVRRINDPSESTWKFDFRIQDNDVLMSGISALTLSESLAF